MASPKGFQHLTPDVVLGAVEQALSQPFSGLLQPLTSYINRVYELEARDRTRYIAKFYRPGRWTRAALQDEHDFVQACAAAEIPVIAPLPLSSGGTLATTTGVSFAIFPKRWGRQFEVKEDEDWRRLGQILGRIHLVGSERTARARLTMDPAHSTRRDVAQLVEGGFVAASQREGFAAVTEELLQVITPRFAEATRIRIHGDLHAANLLERPDEGLLIIDFDDMVMGPPVQDLWMLLPGRLRECRRELDLILEGYERFRAFDWASLRLIEPLRAMRILYFLAWASRQVGDPVFEHNFPDWSRDSFWATQVGELRQQLETLSEGDEP